MPHQDSLELARSAAFAAGDVLMRHFSNPKVSFKQDQEHNLVTQADLEAEAAVLAVIRAARPDEDVLGEEGLSDGQLDAERLWVVDPLDGTTNYAQGIPQFAVAISYVVAGQVQVGVVFDPVRHETFHAVRGEGAFLNGAPIRVSAKTELHEGVIATGFYYDRGELMQRTLDAIGRLFSSKIRGIRRLGAAALDICWVACGRMDGFFEYQLSPWDYAAASIIVEEAGGRCTDRCGAPMRVDSGSLIAATAELHRPILDIVAWKEK